MPRGLFTILIKIKNLKNYLCHVDLLLGNQIDTVVTFPDSVPKRCYELTTIFDRVNA